MEDRTGNEKSQRVKLERRIAALARLRLLPDGALLVACPRCRAEPGVVCPRRHLQRSDRWARLFNAITPRTWMMVLWEYSHDPRSLSEAASDVERAMRVVRRLGLVGRLEAIEATIDDPRAELGQFVDRNVTPPAFGERG